jgi:choline kinase
MVEVGGVPMLTRCIDTCRRAGIRDYIIVVGYRQEMIRESVSDIPGINLKLAVNSRFAATGTAASLELGLAAGPAREVLIIEADVLFSPDVLDLLLGAAAPDATLVDDFEGHSGSLVTLDAEDRVTAWLHEQARPADFDVSGTWKTVNLTRLQPDSVASGLGRALQETIAAHGARAPLELAMERWVRRGADILGIRTAGRPWYEVDTPDDLEIAARLFPG